MAVKQLESHQSDTPKMVPADLFWRISLEQYHAMIDAGFLTEDDPVELLEGWLVQKMPKNAPHSTATSLLLDLLLRLLPLGLYIRAQEPFTTGDSEPEPDLFVVRGSPRDFTKKHPEPRDIPILIEVSDATLYRDRNLKKRLYAAVGIPEYWIVNLRSFQVEIYSEPVGEGDSAEYMQQRTYRENDQIPVTIDNQLLGYITVADVMPE